MTILFQKHTNACCRIPVFSDDILFKSFSQKSLDLSRPVCLVTDREIIILIGWHYGNSTQRAFSVTEACDSAAISSVWLRIEAVFSYDDSITRLTVSIVAVWPLQYVTVLFCLLRDGNHRLFIGNAAILCNHCQIIRSDWRHWRDDLFSDLWLSVIDWCRLCHSDKWRVSWWSRCGNTCCSVVDDILWADLCHSLISETVYMTQQYITVICYILFISLIDCKCKW